MTTIVTTTKGVAALTRQILNADASASRAKEEYLRALVLATQKELGSPGRESQRGRIARLTEDGIKAQLAALEAANAPFYAAVLDECSKDPIPKGADKAKTINQRSNWARTAVYAIRTWIRSGRDVLALAAEKVTKTNITVKREPVPPTPRILTRRVEKGITELIETADELATQDKAAAILQLETALAKISARLSVMGVAATRDPAQAQEERRPFRTKQGVFFPIGVPAGLAAS